MKGAYTISKITYYSRASNKISWKLISKGSFFKLLQQFPFIIQNRSKVNELLKTVGLGITAISVFKFVYTYINQDNVGRVCNFLSSVSSQQKC